jgi:sugar phosphate permease
MKAMATAHAPEFRAYTYALAAFSILQFALTTLANSVAETAAGARTWIPLLNAIAILLYILTGFLAGALAKRRNVLNGLVVGFLAAAISVSFFGTGQGFTVGTILLCLTGAIVAGIGGACSLFLHQAQRGS